VTFFKKVEAKLKEFFTDAPAWDRTASLTLKVIAPIVGTIIGLLDPAIAPLVQPFITKIENGLATAGVVLDDVSAPGASVTLASALSDVTTNLSAILGVAQVKNSATLSKVTATVNLLASEASEIVAVIPAAKAA
jgi:hypothetical protein